MMAEAREPAVCRGCGMVLRGDAYMYGGSAYHPRTGERCPSNFYGGFVCSEGCDRRASMAMENSMPGGPGRYLSDPAAERLRRNWGDR
ncbi:hypothetical protein [Magnetospirillum aberrantis]|uniref:Uncharacterized protein n=1 Tax=Magnetospirillum aberrantis SpK TaxID=908842 RepID=A0A7C9UWD3_9PROT|nr:hypothetical protein [Magnetospirillum aberrantis]NFV80052.1 hypothetical protein [Magnetospirillum aberrantis SpK]